MTACPECGGRGTVPREVYNTATGKTQLLNQTCLSCMGTGKANS